MDGSLFIQVCDSKPYIYDKFLISNNKLSKKLQMNYKSKHTKKRYKTLVDCFLLHYVVKEFLLSSIYRTSFLDMFFTDTNHTSNFLRFVLQETSRDLIDYNWNERVDYMIRERCELNHALSWLSTLGGAFSALGDYFSNCAETAGKISLYQFKLALRMGDPQIESRCKLYFSLSLIQRKRFDLAKRIVQDEYKKGKQSSAVDFRLLNMCKGIWAKLQYEYGEFKKSVNKRRNSFLGFN